MRVCMYAFETVDLSRMSTHGLFKFGFMVKYVAV